MQAVTAGDVGRLMREMRDAGHSGWTRGAGLRIVNGVYSLALRRGVVTRSPVDGLTDAERPEQRNEKEIERLDSVRIAKLVAAANTERWRAALALAAYDGLRLGEVRAVRWGDIDLVEGGAIHVRRALLPDGTAKPPKSKAGVRSIPLFPELRWVLLRWRLRSPHSADEDFVVCTASGGPVQQRNAQRALGQAKLAAGLDEVEGRLSWHSLRHSAGSIWLTEHGNPVTTVALLLGHVNGKFTLDRYGRDPRDEQTRRADVLARAVAAGT